jgi:hypothetical protein
MPVVFTEEMAELIKATVRDHMRGRNSAESSNGNRNTPRVPSQWAICNVNIEGPQDGITAPATGNVEILTRNRQTNHLERSGRIKTLTHRYEGIDLVKDMLIRIKHINGEWMLEAADCEALGSPPS